MENYIKQLEQRIIDLERRFYPIENIMYEQYEKEIEFRKSKDIEKEGYSYNTLFIVESDKGKVEIHLNDCKGYTEKQALYLAQRDKVYPNMHRLVKEGKIKWFKIFDKQIVK